MDLGNLLTAGSLAVAALSLVAVLRKDTRGDARSQGEQMAMLTSISTGVDDIRLEQRRMRDRADQQAKELAECVSSCKSAHRRLDEHERRLNQLQMHPPE